MNRMFGQCEKIKIIIFIFCKLLWTTSRYCFLYLVVVFFFFFLLYFLLVRTRTSSHMNLYVYSHIHPFTHEFHQRILSAQTDGRREACKWILEKWVFFFSFWSNWAKYFEILNFCSCLAVSCNFLFSFSKLIRYLHDNLRTLVHNNQVLCSAINVDLCIMRNNRVTYLQNSWSSRFYILFNIYVFLLYTYIRIN